MQRLKRRVHVDRAVVQPTLRLSSAIEGTLRKSATPMRFEFDGKSLKVGN
jgi:hypothetical protein